MWTWCFRISYCVVLTLFVMMWDGEMPLGCDEWGDGTGTVTGRWAAPGLLTRCQKEGHLLPDWPRETEIVQSETVGKEQGTAVYVSKDVCKKPMAPLFPTAPSWKQLRCPSVREQISNPWGILTVESHVVIRTIVRRSDTDTSHNQCWLNKARHRRVRNVWFHGLSKSKRGAPWVAQLAKHPTSAQVMISQFVS